MTMIARSRTPALTRLLASLTTRPLTLVHARPHPPVHFVAISHRRSLRPHWMVEKEGYIFVFGLDKEGSEKELEAYYELCVPVVAPRV